jgi:hypothetical protein
MEIGVVPVKFVQVKKKKLYYYVMYKYKWSKTQHVKEN